MSLLRIAAVLGLAGSSLSPLPARAANADCFCVRHVPGNGLQQYEVVRYEKPACANQTYQSNGLAPWDNGVPLCAPPPQDAMPAAELTRRCFCVQHVNGDGVRQYRVVRYPTVPQCGRATYQENGRPAWENVLMCNTANECSKSASQCKSVLNALIRRLETDPTKATETAAAVQVQADKCKSIEDFCYVDPIK